MAYTKIVFQNSPSTATPLNAENLNHMDDQIALNDQRLTALEGAHVASFNSRTGAVTSEKGDYDIDQIVASDGQDGYIPVWRNSGTEQEPDWGFAMEEMGGSGHEILDADGTSMAQEDALQFADAFLTDDSVNGRTVVENIKEVSPADYASTTDEGIIVTDDGNDALIGAVSDDYILAEADGTKTWQQLLNSIWSDADKSKITDYAYIYIDGTILDIVYNGSNQCIFTLADVSSQVTASSRIKLASNSTFEEYSSATYKNNTTDIAAADVLLYYGNKKATVDLQTTANRCLMPDGETTVAEAIGGVKNNSIVTNISSYNSESNYYTTPSEGYVRVETAGDTAMLVPQATLLVARGDAISTYVHKGTKVYGKNGNSNASSLRFIPLVSE